MTDPGPRGLFQGAAWYYARYRRGYPDAVIGLIVRRFGLDGTTPVLDLGCGTGQLAIPLAARGVPVHAVDPDVGMLAEGLRAEEASGARGIAWRIGDDGCVDRLHLPPLRAATMGSSFHWMDRERVLATLERLVVPRGGLAVVTGGPGGGSVWSGAGAGWTGVARQVVVEFLGPDRRAAGGTFQHAAERHEAVLARSAFGHLDRARITSVEERTVEEIIGLLLSTSYASPALLGGRLDAFRRVLTERLLRLDPSGVFRDETTTEVLIATRPRPAPRGGGCGPGPGPGGRSAIGPCHHGAS
jgi:SAM-dependent methyltransferase